MKKFKYILKSLWLLAAIGLVQPCASYYDDVHYALTYYIARQSGFTPEQSYRIASACSSVDWDDQTEPVQAHGQVALLADRGEGLIDFAEWGLRATAKLLTERVAGKLLSQFFSGGLTIKEMRETATNARFRFHAFRDELEHDDVIGNGPDSAGAVLDINDQLDNLFEDCVGGINIGVFLHAFEDVDPHAGYGTTWGHNPFAQDSFALHLSRGLPIGGGTDWVATRRYDVENLCRTVNGRLKTYMDAVSPHQYARPHYHNEYASLVARLASINTPPAPIKTDLQRQIFIRYYARHKGVNIDQVAGSLVDHSELAKIAADMGVGLSMADLKKQVEGPNIEAAIATVNAALKAAGMADQIPPHHYQYDMDEFGQLANPDQMDNWVLTGTLTFKTRGTTEKVSAILKQVVRDASGKAKEQELFGIRPAQLSPGVPMIWPKLPIGEVLVEITKQDGTKQKFKCRLTARENNYSALVTPSKEKPKPKPVAKPTPKPTTTPKPPTTKVETANFTGRWNSSVGRFAYHHDLTMSQSGTNVTGTWTHREGTGTIKGTVKGMVLTFTWTATGAGGGSDKGTGSFTMRPGNTFFSGTYSSDHPQGVKGNGWRGTKMN